MENSTTRRDFLSQGSLLGLAGVAGLALGGCSRRASLSAAPPRVAASGSAATSQPAGGSNASRPPIDQRRPAQLQTATFALG
jgi:hypothetical protein